MDTSLHMIPDYRRAVVEVARVLERGGSFVCSTPAVGIHEPFDVTWAKISEKRRLHAFSEEDIQQVCFQNGLNYERVDTNGGVLYFKAKKM